MQKLLSRGALTLNTTHPAAPPVVVRNTELRVYGVQNLRIMDASIMSLVPAAHLQATVYAVAEKAADIIKRHD